VSEPPVPPDSTPMRELLRAIADALTLSAPTTQKAELAYLRFSRDRARLVLFACRRLLAEREADDRDVMTVVGSLRGEAADCPDAYDHEPPGTGNGQNGESGE
jgi:hypothetical protein